MRQSPSEPPPLGHVTTFPEQVVICYRELSVLTRQVVICYRELNVLTRQVVICYSRVECADEFYSTRQSELHGAKVLCIGYLVEPVITIPKFINALNFGHFTFGNCKVFLRRRLLTYPILSILPPRAFYLRGNCKVFLSAWLNVKQVVN